MSPEAFDARAAYAFCLSPEDRNRLPYYDKLVNALGDSATGRSLLEEAPPEQRNPMLVLASLHYQALSGDDVLAPLYRDIGVIPTEAFAASVVARLEAHPQLVRSQLQRSTQTNEPGRSAVLAAVLRELRVRGVTDIHLIDVGTSMGLNLYPDFYQVTAVGPSDPSVLVMEDLSKNLRKGPLPTIHQRIGIDRTPLDPNDPDDVRWLEACLWPEEPLRTLRLHSILEAMRSWPAATRLRGSANALLDVAVARCTPGATPVIFHSWVAAYFTPDEQSTFDRLVRQNVAEGAIWIYFEHPASVAGLHPPSVDDRSPRKGGSQIVVCRPGGIPEHWGWAHPHGRWIALEPPAGSPQP